MFKVAFLLRLRRDDLIRELRWRWKVEVEREGGGVDCKGKRKF